MQPILVEDGQENWTASQTFSFEFFKKVYRSPEVIVKKYGVDVELLNPQTWTFA